jgi:hypothetical protein
MKKKLGCGVGMGFFNYLGLYFNAGTHFRPIELGGWNCGLKYRHFTSNSGYAIESYNSFLLSVNYNSLHIDIGVQSGYYKSLEEPEEGKRISTYPEISIGYLL